MDKNQPKMKVVPIKGHMSIKLSEEINLPMCLDIGGLLLKVCDPYKQVIILDRENGRKDRLVTGFIKRRDSGTFRLRPTKDSEDFILVSYDDIIAWGYVE